MDIGVLNELGYVEVIEISIWIGLMYYLGIFHYYWKVCLRNNGYRSIKWTWVYGSNWDINLVGYNVLWKMLGR